jgi:hypothetical protein
MEILERFFRALLFLMALFWAIIVGFEWNKNNENDLSMIDKMFFSYIECVREEGEKLGGFTKTVAWNGEEYSENRRRNKLMRAACAHYDLDDKKYFPDGKNVNKIYNFKYAILNKWIYIFLSYLIVFSIFISVKYTITGNLRNPKPEG